MRHSAFDAQRLIGPGNATPMSRTPSTNSALEQDRQTHFEKPNVVPNLLAGGALMQRRPSICLHVSSPTPPSCAGMSRCATCMLCFNVLAVMLVCTTETLCNLDYDLSCTSWDCTLRKSTGLSCTTFLHHLVEFYE